MPPRTRTPAPDSPQPATPTQTAPAPEVGGYFRNTGQGDLTVLGDGATHLLAPGRIAPLSRTPTHRDLTPASEADYRAQLAADEAAAKAVAAQRPEDATTPTTDETEA